MERRELSPAARIDSTVSRTGAARENRRLHDAPDYAGDDSDHLRVAAVDRLHRRICRLQTDAIGFRIPVFECGLALVGDCYDDVSLVRRASAAADDDVAIGDLGVDHRVALHSQGKLVLALRKPILEFESIGLFDRLGKITGCNLADERHAAIAAVCIRNLNRARHIRLARDQPLFLQCLQVAHHAVWRADPEILANLANGWAVATAIDFFLYEIENFALTRCKLGEIHDRTPPNS